MRLCMFAICCLSCCVSILAEGAQTFPYRAYVTSDDVYVRSGPGKNYYPAAKLKASTMVEIHRHDPGGWFAIRPPEGCFSWVSARYIEMGEDGLAQVVGDRVAARVGSPFSDIRDVIQVRLHRGEMVEVLETKEFDNTAEGGKWYKILPPSGEFRWISGKFVDSQFDDSGIRKADAADSPLLNPSKSVPALLPTETLPRELLEDESTDRKGSTATFPRKPTLEDRGSNLWAPTLVRSERNTNPVSDPITVEASNVFLDRVVDPQNGDLGRKKPFRRLSPEDFQDELDAIEMELAVMVAEEPTVWLFQQLDHRSQLLFTQAETALERGKARRLVNKIDQAADIKSRYDLLAKMQEGTEKTNRLLSTLRRDRSETDMDENSLDDRFDGKGRLRRVVSKKMGAPRYALLDERGEIACYVTPAPGVSLDYYLGQRVGIIGGRGYIAEQNALHVTAKRVNPLEKRIR